MQSVLITTNVVSSNPAHMGLLDTILCDHVCQCIDCIPTGRWFSSGPPVSSTNKTDRQYITEIVLKVALNTMTFTPPQYLLQYFVLRLLGKEHGGSYCCGWLIYLGVFKLLLAGYIVNQYSFHCQLYTTEALEIY